ncbi:MAG TPA: hypothetical protein VIR60_01905 [Gammaproteobacteria bacterium]
MPLLPRFDVSKNQIQNPHVVILGAGASIAACPNGDLNGLKLPSLQDVQDATGLGELFDRIEAAEGSLGDGFEAKYSRLVHLGRYANDVNLINSAVRDYFSKLQLPDHVTPYDKMILGLRDKDSIFTFNWDPFLLQALRRCSGVASVPNVHFLHGCVDVAFCASCKVKSNAGLPCPRCKNPMKPSQLLFPVTDKDYDSDPVILEEWNALRHALDDAYFVTVFGYSAPVTDVAARKILIDTFSSNRFREMAEVEIIDIRDRAEVETAWADFYFSHHYGIFNSFEHSQINRHFRRSCDAFAMASLQCHPVPENSPTGISSVAELQEFAVPLYQEEQANVKFWEGHTNPFGG